MVVERPHTQRASGVRPFVVGEHMHVRACVHVHVHVHVHTRQYLLLCVGN